MEDLDLDLDNTDRIIRRIAHGVYRITHNRKVVGEELWGIFGLQGGGYRLMTEIDLKWPIPNQQRARLDLDGDWRVRRLWVQLDADGKRRVAHYLPEGDEVNVTVFEEPLRYPAEGNRSPREQALQTAVAAKAKRVFAGSAPYGPETFLDYGSTLLNFAHLRRLHLVPNTQVQIQTVVVTQPSLEPLEVAQTYTYVRDEQITTLIQPFMVTRRYMIEESTDGEDGGPVTTLWTDPNGVAIKQDVLLGKETHGCELISYQWFDA